MPNRKIKVGKEGNRTLDTCALCEEKILLISIFPKLTYNTALPIELFPPPYMVGEEGIAPTRTRRYRFYRPERLLYRVTHPYIIYSLLSFSLYLCPNTNDKPHITYSAGGSLTVVNPSSLGPVTLPGLEPGFRACGDKYKI